MNNHHRRQPDNVNAPWRHREDIVHDALVKNIPWLCFICAGFSLIVFFRNLLFAGYDQSLAADAQILKITDALMVLIFALSAAVTVLMVVARRRSVKHMQRWVAWSLLVLSLSWSFCAYQFIARWSLPVAYPLCVILLLAGMCSLYFSLPAFAGFIAPLWLTLLPASMSINAGINLRFFVIWLFFSVIIITGRFLLLRWFNEACRRYLENLLLMTRLNNLAHQDVLTHTANRRALDDYLLAATAQQQPLALLMLDVDYFKRFNDCYGHQAGDECLKRVAEVLRASARTPEDLVARYGGEEFVLILPDADLTQARQVAERIRQKLADAAIPHAKSEINAAVTVSIGLAASRGDVAADALIAQADAALYRAKEQGRNRWMS